MSYVLTDTNRRLLYLSSEAGENLTLSADGSTVSIAYDSDVVLPAATSKAACKTHLLPIDKTITTAS